MNARFRASRFPFSNGLRFPPPSGAGRAFLHYRQTRNGPSRPSCPFDIAELSELRPIRFSLPKPVREEEGRASCVLPPSELFHSSEMIRFSHFLGRNTRPPYRLEPRSWRNARGLPRSGRTRAIDNRFQKRPIQRPMREILMECQSP